ncbi:MAG: GntR family transcriptional regulator [Gaiellales bacterium]
MSTVDDHRLPRHYRVYRFVADQITHGELPPGAQLPSERSLCDQLQVSRTTVRRALAALSEDGLVESAPGRGTFVTGGPLIEPANGLLSFTELGRRRGLAPSARVLEHLVRPATFDEAERFRVAPGAELFELRRLRMLDGAPVAVDDARVPLARVPGVLEADFETASLFGCFEQAGCPPMRADYTVEAAAADERTAELLEMVAGGPVLLAATTSFDSQGRILELARTFYRGDRYRFQSSLVRRR